MANWSLICVCASATQEAIWTWHSKLCSDLAERHSGSTSQTQSDITYFAGGLLGGLLASWWYDSGGVDRLSAAIDGSAAAAETPSPGHVLQIRERR